MPCQGCVVRWLTIAGMLAAAGGRNLEVKGAPPSPINIKAVTVRPRTVCLSGKNQLQQIQVTGTTDDGTAVDLTDDCQLEVRDGTIASLDGTTLRGQADGRTALLVRHGARRVEVPVETAGLSEPPPLHFTNDIIPILSKAGCNSGGCHGKAAGQNGFKLSVFGSDPRADYTAIVDESRGRRLFAAAPQESLLVLKASGRVPHGGGRRLPTGTPDYELMINWIRQGAPWGDADAPVVESIVVEPAQRQLRLGAAQQLLVTARFSDGSTRDVTSAATYTSNAEVVADADQRGHVQSGTVPGEAAITVNYMGRIGAARILIPRQATMDWSAPPIHNEIDRLVWNKLSLLKIRPSELCDDATFQRRLFLNTLGTIPTAEEVRTFLADGSTDRRRRLIDEILQRPEYADYWAMKWADVLLVDRKAIGERGAYEFHRWLRSQLARNRPYDEWVHELLTASGNSARFGPVNFFRAARTPDDLTRTVSQAFLGIRLDCAQCHHHPFDRWGQADFYGLAGFFNGMERQSLSPDREIVFHSGTQPAKLPLTGKTVPIRPPGDASVKVPADGDPRFVLADWVTSPENPYFARLAANRLWKQFLGRGLVEPEDDLRATNPATNEPLLDYLANDLVEHQFDLKALMRLILNSRVYQLSSRTNETNADDNQNFSRYSVRRLPAEVLLDAISSVADVPEKFSGMPAGTRAIQLWDNRLPSYFLDTFGRSPRESPCECGRSGAPTMAQALHLMNAPELESKVAHPDGRAARLARGEQTVAAMTDELTLTALGRFPTVEERRVAERLFAASDRRQAAEDYLWVLLNSYDFLFVH